MAKTMDEKIAEKETSLLKVNNLIETTTGFYEVLVENYKAMYDANAGKNVDDHMSGISNVLRRLNDLLVTKSNIENEINNMLELQEQDENFNKEQINGETIPEEKKDRKFTGSKESILKLVKGGEPAPEPEQKVVEN